MPLYPLGICRGEDLQRVPEQIAAGAASVRWSHVEELACAVIDARANALKPIQHAAAIEAIHRCVCVLPMRFGTIAHDEAEIRDLLQPRRGELLERLNRLEGTCEMAIRITSGSPQNIARDESSQGFHAATSSASNYLEQRRAHYRRVDAAEEIGRSMVQKVVQRLQGTFRDWRRLPSWPLSPGIRMEFLVEQSRVADFRSRLENLHTAGRGGRCMVLGPWAPYSFA